MNVLISDFDGTLARISFKPKIADVAEKLPRFVYYIMMSILGIGYVFRLPNERTKAFVKNYKGRVVVHSSTKDILPCRIAIKLWLLIHRIPYDKLILRKHGQTKEHFKYMNIINESGNLVLENEQPIIDYLREKIGDMEVLFQERDCQVLAIR